MKVLLVEDERTTRHMLEEILAGRGHDVTACTSAEEAWELYRTQAQDPYQLVILDWLLPNMDGLELSRRLGTLRHRQRSVILVVTVRDRPGDLEDVLDAGADDYLTKPIDIPLLQVRLHIAERKIKVLQERQRAEDALRESEAKWRALVTNAPVSS